MCTQRRVYEMLENRVIGHMEGTWPRKCRRVMASAGDCAQLKMTNWHLPVGSARFGVPVQGEGSDALAPGDLILPVNDLGTDTLLPQEQIQFSEPSSNTGLLN